MGGGYRRNTQKKTVRFPAASARKQGTNGSSAPSGSTGHDPHKCPKMAKEDANLAISDQAGLVADADAFVSVSQGEHEFRFGCSGGTEGFDCEIGEVDTWIVTVLHQDTWPRIQFQ